MNDQLQASEENEFDPLLLMDDLIVDMDIDDGSMESDDESESDESYQEKSLLLPRKFFPR